MTAIDHLNRPASFDCDLCRDSMVCPECGGNPPSRVEELHRALEDERARSIAARRLIDAGCPGEAAALLRNGEVPF